jgi:hypothetical protein
MLDLHGHAILMDFGIVKIIGGQYNTATGATIGTAMYMSPEQIRSERADERSDIYSLGVTLYEMLSGRTPYYADSVMTLMMMVLNDPLPDIRQIRKEIPEGLATVVEKALAKVQADRFQTMGEMAAALQQVKAQVASRALADTVLDDERAEQATVLDSPIEEPKELKIASAELEGAEALRRGEPQAPKPKTHRENQRVSAAPTLKDSSPRVKGIGRSSARRIIIATATLLLVIAAVVGIGYVQSQEAPTLQTTPINQPSTPINAQTAQSVVSLAKWETNSFIAGLAFSPDGNLIATANNREWVRFSKYRFYSTLWQVDTGSLQQHQLKHTDRVNDVAFSPDGQLFATVSEDDSLILWRVSDGSLVRRIEALLGGTTSVDFSPSNLLLAAGSSDGDVGLWQVSDGHLLRTLQGREHRVRDVEFSPEGDLLASGSDDHVIKLWQVSDGNLVHTLRGHTAPIRELTFSPDGTWLASASEDHTVRLWQVSDGSLVKSMQGHSEFVLAVAFSTDSSLLASGAEDGKLMLWQVANGEMLRVLGEHSDSITCVTFSPDGHTLVSGAADGILQFWGLSDAIPLETETPDP